MSTPTCPACGHAANDHSNLAACMSAGCGCMTKRRDIAARADAVATAEALDRVERGTSPAWKAAAVKAVVALAHAATPFTTDDVWDTLDADPATPDCREPRALGPIMKAATRAGTIRLEGYATSRRRHGSLIRSYVGGQS